MPHKKIVRNDFPPHLTIQSRTAQAEAKTPMNLHHPEARTLEVHPVPLTCLLHRNLPSGSRERDGLGVPLLLQAIGEASSLGYNLLHISGEDPLRCASLHSL